MPFDKHVIGTSWNEKKEKEDAPYLFLVRTPNSVILLYRTPRLTLGAYRLSGGHCLASPPPREINKGNERDSHLMDVDEMATERWRIALIDGRDFLFHANDEHISVQRVVS